MNIVVCVKQVPDTWAEKKLSDVGQDRRPRGRRGRHERARRVRHRRGAADQGGARRRGHGPDDGSGEGDRDDPQGAVDGRRPGGPRGRRRRCTAPTRSARRTRWPRRSATVEHDIVAARRRVHRRPDERDPGDARRAARRGAADAWPARSRSATARSRSSGRPTPATTWSRPRLRSSSRVVEKINEPRYPSFKGIMAAKKKPLTTLTLADAGIEADKVGLAGVGLGGDRVRRAAAEGGRSDRQGRGRRRRQAGRVPRVPEDRLRQEYDDTWLRSWFWSSTSTGRPRRSPSSC